MRQLLAEGKEFNYTDAVADNTPLVQENVLDSFDMITLVALIEEKFGITFDPDDVRPENFLSIHSIAVFLASKLSDASGC